MAERGMAWHRHVEWSSIHGGVGLALTLDTGRPRRARDWAKVELSSCVADRYGLLM